MDKLTNGRVAYVYMPDTAFGGYTNFNRYFYAQVDKEAAIIDERFNGGGTLADHIIEHAAADAAEPGRDARRRGRGRSRRARSSGRR